MMFDFLGPIGAIQSEDGSLEIGNVGVTNCLYLSYKGQADFVPTVLYNPDEVADLIQLVELAVTEIKSIAKGTILRIGSMSAKPITLRLALVHPHQQEPFLLLRLLQGNWSQDVTCPPESLLQLLKVGQVDGPKPLAGRLKRESDGAWNIGGKKLELVQGLSPGRGRSGEYVHPDDVKEGEEVEVWPFSVGSKSLLGTFRFKDKDSGTASPSETLGERADRYLCRGQNHLAREEILKLADDQLKSGKVTAPWAAKASLTFLLAELADGNDSSAQNIWLGRSDNKFLRIGIDCMEAGQTSSRDILIYHQISAYFHSLNPEVPSALRGVNDLMTTVCEGCSEVARDMLPTALCNWYLYLKEVCEKEPPAEVLKEWNKAVQRSGLTPRPKVISFPKPDTWVIEEELISTDDIAASASTPVASRSEPPSSPSLLTPKTQVDSADKEPPSPRRFLLAFFLFLLVCLGLSKLFQGSPERPEVDPAFTGNPALSISGVSLNQSWDEVDSIREWEVRQKTILSSYLDGGYLTVRFDADKNLKYIEGNELSQNGRPLFTRHTELAEVLTHFGEPSEQKKGRFAELTYVYDDAGQKCVLTMFFRSDRPVEYDPRTGQEIGSRGPHLDRVRLSLAGTRRENTPSLPILAN